jgi:hypothetical protein
MRYRPIGRFGSWLYRRLQITGEYYNQNYSPGRIEENREPKRVQKWLLSIFVCFPSLPIQTGKRLKPKLGYFVVAKIHIIQN